MGRKTMQGKPGTRMDNSKSEVDTVYRCGGCSVEWILYGDHMGQTKECPNCRTLVIPEGLQGRFDLQEG